jgi:hypothetical protein
MDSSFFIDKKGRLRDSYEFLCEFVHPNNPGIWGLYVSGNSEEYRVRFNDISQKKRDLLPQIGIALGLIAIVDHDIADIDASLGELTGVESVHSSPSR